MKKFTLIILMLIISCSVKGQVEFAPVGTKWHYDYSYLWTSGYVLIESVSDTVIDGVACRKLSKSKVIYDQIEDTAYEEIFGYEYMTQINDSVMIYRDGEFKKLYDFGSEVGDTLIIPGHNNYDPALINGQGVVVDKGTIELDGHTLRYIDLKQPYDWEESPWAFSCYVNYNNSNYNTVRICEKIGNISGYLLPEPYFMADAEEGGTIRCYSDDVMSVAFQDKECDYIVSVEETSSQGSINIFPNPANDEINIELTSDCHTIEIYDSFGRMMMRQQIAETTSQQVVNVDISKYPSGLYLVVVKDDNSRYYKRIVKN